MPLVDWEEKPTRFGGGLQLEPTPMPAKTTLAQDIADIGTVMADNPSARYLRWLRSSYQPQEGYNPFAGDKLRGYEDHMGEFAQVKSEEELIAKKQIIDEQQRVNRLLEDGSWFGLKGAHLFANIVGDPITWVPIGGLYAKGGSLAYKAATGAALTAAATGASDVINQMTGIGEFDWTQFVGSTAAGAVLGAALGPIIGKAIRPGERALAEQALDTHLKEAMVAMNKPADDILTDLAMHAANEEKFIKEGMSVEAAAEKTAFASRAASSTDQLIEGKVHEMPPAPPTAVVNESNVLVGSSVVEKTTMMSPLLRGMTSLSATMRDFMLRFADNNLYTTGNVAGDVANPLAASTERKMWIGTIDNMRSEISSLGAQLIKRLDDEGIKLTIEQFRDLVGKAYRRGTSAVPEIAQAVKVAEAAFEYSGKRAADAGLLKYYLTDGVDEAGLTKYITRKFNKDAINANREGFIKKLIDHWTRKEPSLDINVARAHAEAVANKIGGKQITDDIFADIISTPQVLKKRVLDINDIDFEDFLVNDIDELIQHNSYQLSREAAWTSRFGARNSNQLPRQIQADYEALIAANPNNAQQLQARLARDLKDFEQLRDRYFGVHNNKIGEGFRNVLSFVSMYNTLRMLGGVLLSSLADSARPIYLHGLGRYAATMMKMVSEFDNVKMTKEAMRKFGVGMEMTGQSRLMQWADLFDGAPATNINKMMSTVTDKFGKITLISQWTAWWKEFTGVMAQDFIIESSHKWAAGTLKASDKKKLLMMGIDEQMTKRILREVESNGANHKGVWLNNIDNWADQEAADTVKMSILKTVDTVINTPNDATKPLLGAIDNSIAKQILQFKSFAFASHVQTLIPALQQRDAAAYTGLVVSVMFGSLAMYAKTKVSGRELPDDPAAFLGQAINESGALALPVLAWDTGEKLFGIEASDMLSSEKPKYKKYGDVGFWGQLLGPTAGTIEQNFGPGKTASNALKALTGDGNMTYKDFQNLRKMLPLNNLFYLSWLFNKAEHEMADGAGVKIPQWVHKRDESGIGGLVFGD